MDLQELMELLEIEAPEEFEYFEHLAALLESTEEISPEAFHQVLAKANPANLGEILENYFDEIIEGAPDSSNDFYLLLTNMGRTLTGLAKTMQDADDRRTFAEELARFREWYSLEEKVVCTKITDRSQEIVSPAVALATARMEKLGGDEYDYDFSEVLDYEIDEYILPLTTGSGGDYDFDEDYDGESGDDFDEGLVHRDNPVIDGPQVLH